MFEAKEDSNQPFSSLSPGVFRASTVVFDSLEDFVNRKQRQPDGYSYGITGTPTARRLERDIARLEGGEYCIVTPSGQSALCTAVMGFVRGGDHLLISAACYGALQTFAHTWLSSFGVEVETYAPDIGAEISALIKPNTRMICLEAPGTVTMEMPDIPAIVAVAKSNSVMTLMDNTWASPLAFKPIEAGVDLSVEAATKFFGGHSDVLLGAITMSNYGHYETLRETQSIMGQQASPEDCFLVLRGLETLRMRYEAQSRSALDLAGWLKQQPDVQDVLFPPLEGDAGHAIWKRDFEPGGCLFSVILRTGPQHAHSAFFAALRHFSIGASWGGVHSLAAFYPQEAQQSRRFPRTDQSIIRLSIGLEPTQTLQDDLNNALIAYQRHCVG